MADNSLFFNAGGISPASDISDFCMEFADGWHIVPGWMISHLGGARAMQSSEVQIIVKRMTAAEFNKRFHEEVAKETLSAIGKQIITDHLRNFRS